MAEIVQAFVQHPENKIITMIVSYLKLKEFDLMLGVDASCYRTTDLVSAEPLP